MLSSGQRTSTSLEDQSKAKLAIIWEKQNDIYSKLLEAEKNELERLYTVAYHKALAVTPRSYTIGLEGAFEKLEQAIIRFKEAMHERNKHFEQSQKKLGTLLQKIENSHALLTESEEKELKHLSDASRQAIAKIPTSKDGVDADLALEKLDNYLFKLNPIVSERAKNLAQGLEKLIPLFKKIEELEPNLLESEKESLTKLYEESRQTIEKVTATTYATDTKKALATLAQQITITKDAMLKREKLLAQSRNKETNTLNLPNATPTVPKWVGFLYGLVGKHQATAQKCTPEKLDNSEPKPIVVGMRSSQ